MKIRRRAIAAGLALALIALTRREALAQTIALDVDLSILNLGPVVVTPIDDDGNPATQAWLISIDPFTPASPNYRRRLLVVRANGSLCLEAPFDPRVGFPSTRIDEEIVRMGNRDVLQLMSDPLPQGQPMRILTVDRLLCR